MIKKKYLPFIITAIFFLTASLFMVFPTRSDDSKPNYDPESDINSDGTINILDAIRLSTAYGGSGEPISRASEASYIVYQNATCCLAKNGTTGNVDFSSWNASQVINKAIQALATTGGEVLLRQGKYTLDTSIILNVAGLTLEGESKQSVWIYPNSTTRPATLINVSRQGQGQSGRDGADTGNIRISGLSFDNTAFTTYNLTSAIYFDISYPHNILWLPTVENCYFINLDAVHTSTRGDPDWCIQAPTFRDIEVVCPHNTAFSILDSIDATFDDIWIYFPYNSNTYTPNTTGLYLCSRVTCGATIQNFRCFRADFGIYLNSSDDARLSNCICDLDGISYEIYNSSRCALTNCYAGAPFGVCGYGFHPKHGSDDTIYTNCQARECITGFFDDQSSGEQPGPQCFIGCSSTHQMNASFVDWNINYIQDMMRGCFDTEGRKLDRN